MMYTTCAGDRWRDPGPRGLTREDRFWAKVNKDGPISIQTGTACWVWTASVTGSTSKDGIRYGQFGTGERAHRVSWEAANGPIPDGLDVCHHCDNPACVRPDHLFLGTAKQNADDMVSKGRFRGPARAQTRFGEATNFATLTAEQVREIRAATGVQREIAERYGINQSTVSRIKASLRWERLDVPGAATPEIHQRAGSLCA